MSETASRRPWWAIALAVLGIAALAFAVGRFSTFGSAAPAVASDSADAGFARDMQIHHAQAVEMAMEIYRKTEDDELRVLAYDIATAQAAQRGEMYDWLVRWGLPQIDGPLMGWMADDAGHGGHGGGTGDAPSEQELLTAMGMASGAELAELREAEGRAADCLFLELMIRHHEGAVPMAQALIDRGSDARALAVAATIKAGQTAEIDAMTAMQSRLGCSG